jgi:hypothetical protein
MLLESNRYGRRLPAICGRELTRLRLQTTGDRCDIKIARQQMLYRYHTPQRRCISSIADSRRLRRRRSAITEQTARSARQQTVQTTVTPDKADNISRSADKAQQDSRQLTGDSRQQTADDSRQQTKADSRQQTKQMLQQTAFTLSPAYRKPPSSQQQIGEPYPYLCEDCYC